MPDTMTAARFHGMDRGLVLEEVPVPEPQPNEVLVKVEACGICLSDVHLLDGTLRAPSLPVTPGHESAGTVAAIGAGVTGWAPGDRVAIMGGRNCFTCPFCQSGRFQDCQAVQLMGFAYDGAWAEYTLAMPFSLTAIPDHIPFEQAAILADAVSTPFAALEARADLRPGETIGLWGIGGLGVHAVQLARMMGAGLVIAVDPLADARERALRVGADLALDPTEDDFVGKVRRATGGQGLDVALDLVGMNAVLKQASMCLGRRGRLLIVGLSAEKIELGPNVVFGVMAQSLLGHLGYDKRHLDTLVRLLANGRIDVSESITDVLPLTEIHAGVRRLEEKLDNPVRLVVRP